MRTRADPSNAVIMGGNAFNSTITALPKKGPVPHGDSRETFFTL